MEQKRLSLVHVSREFMPHLIMVLAQVGYTLLNFVSEASFNHGMSPYVYVTYRHVVAGVVMLPFAYFLERKLRPKLTFALVMEIFVLSLLGLGIVLLSCEIEPQGASIVRESERTVTANQRRRRRRSLNPGVAIQRKRSLVTVPVAITPVKLNASIVRESEKSVTANQRRWLLNPGVAIQRKRSLITVPVVVHLTVRNDGIEAR